MDRYREKPIVGRQEQAIEDERRRKKQGSRRKFQPRGDCFPAQAIQLDRRGGKDCKKQQTGARQHSHGDIDPPDILWIVKVRDQRTRGLGRREQQPSARNRRARICTAAYRHERAEDQFTVEKPRQ